MKTENKSGKQGSGGYALLMVLAMVGASVVILAATLTRTLSEARINDRNNQSITGVNAAEAAVEKVVAQMRYDFLNYGLSGVTARLNSYTTNYPLSSENPYWANYILPV